MRVKTDAKRQEILDAAAAVLREQGFARASMSAVSKQIGASKATLYRYFSSREDLFLTALLDVAHDEATKLFDMLRPTQNLRVVLERFGIRFLELTLSPEVLAVRRILIAEGSRSGLGQRLFERGAKSSWAKMRTSWRSRWRRATARRGSMDDGHAPARPVGGGHRPPRPAGGRRRRQPRAPRALDDARGGCAVEGLRR